MTFIRLLNLWIVSHLFGSTILNGHGGSWTARISPVGFHFPDNVQTGGDLAKNNVLAVQPGRIGGTDKELRSVGVGSGVGHAQRSDPAVVQVKVFVLESSSVNALATGSVAIGKVTTLAHESRNDAVKAGSLVSLSLVFETELLEVFDRLGDRRSVQTHFDASRFRSVDINVKVDRFGDFGFGGSHSQHALQKIEVELGGTTGSGSFGLGSWRKSAGPSRNSEKEASCEEERSSNGKHDAWVWMDGQDCRIADIVSNEARSRCLKAYSCPMQERYNTWIFLTRTCWFWKLLSYPLLLFGILIVPISQYFNEQVVSN